MGPSTTKKNRARTKNRRTKVHLIFHESDRIEYLKGFKKRKDERRQKAREEMEKRLKEEKKRHKEEQRELLRKMYHMQQSLPEVEHLVQPITYDFENHTVTVSSIADIDFQGKNGLLLGQNKDEDSDEEATKDTQELQTTEKKPGLSNLKQLKKDHIKKMKASKAMQMKQKIQQKKNRQHARRKNILKKRDKHKGRR